MPGEYNDYYIVGNGSASRTSVSIILLWMTNQIELVQDVRGIALLNILNTYKVEIASFRMWFLWITSVQRVYAEEPDHIQDTPILRNLISYASGAWSNVDRQDQQAREYLNTNVVMNHLFELTRLVVELLKDDHQ